MNLYWVRVSGYKPFPCNPFFFKKQGLYGNTHLFVSAHGTHPYNPDSIVRRPQAYNPHSTVNRPQAYNPHSLVDRPLPYNPDSLVNQPQPYNPHSLVNRTHPLKTKTSPTITLAFRASENSWATNRTGGVGG